MSNLCHENGVGGEMTEAGPTHFRDRAVEDILLGVGHELFYRDNRNEKKIPGPVDPRGLRSSSL
jgi:hypothetical protein